MRAFFLLLGMWYLQDLMQVLLTTAFLGPELFFMALTRFTCHREYWGNWSYLIPLVGGLAFDLRWSGIPGLCALLYLLAYWVFKMVWFDRLPLDGRRPISFFLVNLTLLCLLGGIRTFFWRGSGSLGHLLWLGTFHLILTVPPLWLFSVFGRVDDETPRF